MTNRIAQLGVAEDGVGHQRRRAEAQPDFGQPDDAAPVDRIGESATDEGGHHQGKELGEAQQADHQGKTRKLVCLER